MLQLLGRKYIGFENALARQVQASGLAIEMDFLEVEDLDARLIAQQEALSGRYDITMVPGDFYATLIERGMLLPLDDFLAQDPPEDWPSGWAENLMDYQRGPDGRLYGLPYHDGPEALIYRKDLLQAAQLAPPRTWDEFLHAAQQLNAPDHDRHGCIIAAFPDAHNICYDFFLQVWSRGGEVLDPAGNPRFHEAPGVEGLQYLLDLIFKHKVSPPDSPQVDSVQSGLRFAEGKIGMMVNWLGFASFADSHASSNVRGQVGVALLPSTPGVPSISLSNYWCLAIPAGSRQPSEAYKFLRHCASAAMDSITLEEGCIPCRRSTWTRAAAQGIAGFALMEPLQASARTLPPVTWYGALREILNDELGRAYRGEASATDALQSAARKVSARA